MRCCNSFVTLFLDARHALESAMVLVIYLYARRVEQPSEVSGTQNKSD
jgi:hypothetical protein